MLAQHNFVAFAGATGARVNKEAAYHSAKAAITQTVKDPFTGHQCTWQMLEHVSLTIVVLLLQVLQEPGLTKKQQYTRAKAVKKLGSIFSQIDRPRTAGGVTNIMEEFSDILMVGPSVHCYVYSVHVYPAYMLINAYIQKYNGVHLVSMCCIPGTYGRTMVGKPCGLHCSVFSVNTCNVHFLHSYSPSGVSLQLARCMFSSMPSARTAAVYACQSCQTATQRNCCS